MRPVRFFTLGSATMRIVKRVAPVTLLAAGACFATRGDVRLLQDEIRATRATVARADTMQRTQIDSIRASLVRASDSLRMLSARVGSMQAGTSSELYEMGRQLITIQELLGQQTRRLQDLRAATESRYQDALAAVADTGPRAAPPQGGAPAAAGPSVPGPATLFTESRNQLQRNSCRTARAGFQELLASYPRAEEAPAAQLHIAESYICERNQAAADSVYQLVVTTYPRSPEAPTALYKRAKMLIDAGQPQPARPLLQRIIQEYPQSIEADLAREALGTSR